MDDIQNEFISTVSHEMRTPLTSIRGFSQTLLNSWDKLDEDNKKKFVKIIEEQSNRLINLVENILTVSKINSDKPKFKEVDVNIGIEKVVQMISQKYKEHKIVLNLNKNLPSARLDEDKFQQVMTNVIDNACKYSKPDKDVIISTSFASDDKVSIKVIDHGIGMDPMDREKIFEKFVRLENHLTSTTQGNGLGLYITKNLVETMNGTISAYSIPNVSTEFWIEFPFYNQEEALKCSQQS
ncbi:MAG: HAMP domain-containing histidine kinase [Cyanobacteria bacterium SIG31]|nr:HAMP domain-containing histidine kinase [Cyanobacteria bacterium SIG31]